MVIVINLYTVRILLEALGVDNFGIYNVVGGVTAFATIISGALASGAQRFFAVEIGRGDTKRLGEVFNTTNLIYWAIAAVVILLLETIGLWFVNSQMVFDAERMGAVNWVFQCSIITLVANILSAPYNALLIAHEKMGTFSIIAIADNLLKLAIVIALPHLGSDRLIAYAVTLALASLSIRVVYQAYCWWQFAESRFRRYWDSTLARALIAYSGYNMIGLVAIITRNHGVNIITNIFFGTAINAARAIATQTGVVLSSLVNNLYMSSRPQITKYFARGESEEMWGLLYLSAKASYYLLMMVSVPLFIEIEYVLGLWLGDYPALVPIFIRLTIVVLLIETTTNQLFAVLQAANKIKGVQLTSSLILLLNLPVSYMVFVGGGDEISPFYVSILISILYIASIIYVAKRDVRLDIGEYLRMIATMVAITVVVYGALLCIREVMASGFVRLVTICATSVVVSAAMIWIMAMSRTERELVKRRISKKLE
ncbi:MAG: hypothetical protein SNH63_01900 [Rikenellaceae bacterium]